MRAAYNPPAPGQEAHQTTLKPVTTSGSWTENLVSLGMKLRKKSTENKNQQLIVTTTIPGRSYAAVLIGCGWILGNKPANLPSPIDTMRSLTPGQRVRSINSQNIVTGKFQELDESNRPAKARFGGSQWVVSNIRALTAIDDASQDARHDRPLPGSIGSLYFPGLQWDYQLALASADLAIIGNKKALKRELDLTITSPEAVGDPTETRSLLRTEESYPGSSTTTIMASATLETEELNFERIALTILDGNSAIKQINDIESDLIVSVIDRNITDQSGAETIRQLRNTRGSPISIQDQLKWRAAPGIEALAFEVPI